MTEINHPNPARDFWEHIRDTYSWNEKVFIGAAHDDPKEQYFVFTFAPSNSNPRWLREGGDLQILCTAAKSGSAVYHDADRELWKLKDWIEGIFRFESDTALYIRAVHLNGPRFLGYDEDSRHKFSMNFEITYEPFEGTNRDSL